LHLAVSVPAEAPPSILSVSLSLSLSPPLSVALSVSLCCVCMREREEVGLNSVCDPCQIVVCCLYISIHLGYMWAHVPLVVCSRGIWYIQADNLARADYQCSACNDCKCCTYQPLPRKAGTSRASGLCTKDTLHVPYIRNILQSDAPRPDLCCGLCSENICMFSHFMHKIVLVFLTAQTKQCTPNRNSYAMLLETCPVTQVLLLSIGLRVRPRLCHHHDMYGRWAESHQHCAPQ
jgi:hypothetical protein